MIIGCISERLVCEGLIFFFSFLMRVRLCFQLGVLPCGVRFCVGYIYIWGGYVFICSKFLYLGWKKNFFFYVFFFFYDGN